MAIQTDCPSCAEAIEVEDRYAGWTVRCPVCRHEFVAPTAAAPADESGDPRRGRRADRLARAARSAGEAAVLLRFFGLAEVIVGLLVTLVFTTVGVQLANNPPAAVRNFNAKNEDELWAGVVEGLTIGVMWVAAGVVVLVGAGKMARLESHGWAVAAGVVACVPFLNCCCVGLPVGVIALSVLGRPDVREAFADARRRRDDPDGDFRSE